MGPTTDIVNVFLSNVSVFSCRSTFLIVIRPFWEQFQLEASQASKLTLRDGALQSRLKTHYENTIQRLSHMRCIKVFCENPPKELIVFFRNSWRFFIFPKRLRRLLENEIPGENYSPKFLSFFLNEGLLNGNIRDRGFIEIRNFRLSVILRGFQVF